MPRLFKRSHRYNVAKNTLLAKIILLDSTVVDFNPLPEVTGADCLEKVAQTLDIQETSYFGLQFQTRSETMRWVEREKPLRRQLEKYAINGVQNAELRFRVQYYVTSVTKLEFEVTRYLYFLQLKHLILNGELQCSHDIAVKLASYALQAEFGDHEEEKHTPQFLSEYVFLPPNVGPPTVIQSLTEKASKQHQRHRGMSPPAAELMYIKIAQQLPEYGHEAFQTLDVHGSTIWIGACFIGVFVKHSNGQPTIYFKWPDIYRMKVRDKNFGIETPSETIYFKMPDNSTAQYVLRMMINQHKFYVSELEGTPGISWMRDGAHARSRSAHDLRSTSTKYPEATVAKTPGSEKKSKLRKLFHPPFFKESGRLSASRRREEELTTSERAEHHPLHPSNGAMHSHTFSAPVHTVSQSPTRSSNSRKSPLLPHTPTSSPNSPLHTTTIATIEEHPSPEAPPITTPPSTYSRSVSPSSRMSPPGVRVEEEYSEGVKISRLGSPLLSKLSPLLGGKKGRSVKTPTLTISNGGLDSIDGDAASQESFDIQASLKKKKKFTGSLDQLETRTPPKSLKIRTFSSEEQAEQEAASGTHDRRGDSLEKRLSRGDFYTEYEEMPTKSHDSDINAGQLPENIPKNRYKDILPYEETRVKLNPQNNTSHNDYINASYVDVPYQDTTHHYIVAQGPLEHTCADFWQMIWEKEIQVVVMLTNEWEGGRCKCHRYFPEDEEGEGDAKPDYVQFEQYRISRSFINKTSTVINRGLQLKHIPTGETREVMHLQYVDWPDHGIPEDPQPFLNFLEEIRSLRQKYDSSIPILLHCSAGVGRSGVVVLMDQLMGLVDSGETNLDIPGCLRSLRNQRMHLVQMVGQYKFVYTSIVQYIKRARLI
jgi:protein tyrosine phosphatase